MEHFSSSKRLLEEQITQKEAELAILNGKMFCCSSYSLSDEKLIRSTGGVALPLQPWLREKRVQKLSLVDFLDGGLFEFRNLRGTETSSLTT